MTLEQDDLIAQFKATNAASSDLEGYDPANQAKSTELYNQLKNLARKLQSSGLQMNGVGDWVEPSEDTFNFTE